jgi:transposase
MRYELTDREWTVIKPILPNKPRGVRRRKRECQLAAIFDVFDCAQASNATSMQEPLDRQRRR